MKKFLSLVLALVMTMSLVTVSAGAKDFSDDGSITYRKLSTSSAASALSTVIPAATSSPLSPDPRCRRQDHLQPDPGAHHRFLPER